MVEKSVSNLCLLYLFLYSKYPYDYSSYNNRLDGAVRHPVAQKKHQMFGKRYFQDQTAIPAIPQNSAVPANVQSQQTSDMSVKYEYEPYPMHHQPIANNLEGATGGVPLNKHHSQQQQPQQPLNQQNGEMKYSCSLDFARQNSVRGIDDIVGHNHTYTLPQGTGATPRPQARDKKISKKSDDEHLTRDEKRARNLNVSGVNFS